MNKAYIAGRNFEYKIKKLLEERGYVVLRTAGSHGPFDLVAIDSQHKTILLIQCKAYTSTQLKSQLLRESVVTVKEILLSKQDYKNLINKL